jgi:hypothetical protein
MWEELAAFVSQTQTGFGDYTHAGATSFQKYSEDFRPSSGLVPFPVRILSRVSPGRRNGKRKFGGRKERNRMIQYSAPGRKLSALLAIGAGGLIAGALDLTQACILFGWRIPLTIAGGLLGPNARHGGVGTYALGVVLHFFIACSAAAIYYAANLRLGFLKDHPLVCGLFFGAAVEEVMSLVVLPLSALHARGPYELEDLILGLLVHMVVVGLPIAYSVRRFAK